MHRSYLTFLELTREGLVFTTTTTPEGDLLLVGDESISLWEPHLARTNRWTMAYEMPCDTRDTYRLEQLAAELIAAAAESQQAVADGENAALDAQFEAEQQKAVA